MSVLVTTMTETKQQGGSLTSLPRLQSGSESVKPLVYIAGPYTLPDPVENTHHAIKLGMDMYETGLIAPVIPHVSLLMHMVVPKPYQFWLDYDLDFLPHCHALYRMEGASAGADEEVKWAEIHSIPTFYKLVDLYQWASRWRTSFG